MIDVVGETRHRGIDEAFQRHQRGEGRVQSGWTFCLHPGTLGTAGAFHPGAAIIRIISSSTSLELVSERHIGPSLESIIGKFSIRFIGREVDAVELPTELQRRVFPGTIIHAAKHLPLKVVSTDAEASEIGHQGCAPAFAQLDCATHTDDRFPPRLGPAELSLDTWVRSDID